MTTYSILTRNHQGATEGHVGTRAQINHWLSCWQDPQNLTAEVTNEAGELIATKPVGRKTVKWPTHPNRSKPRDGPPT